MALALLALAGCGRRGDLEPPSAAVVQAPENKRSLELRRADHAIAPPKKDFVLDPLLQ